MLNLNIPVHNQVTFGSKSLRKLGPKVWDSLPYHIKFSENLYSFKMIIKHWNDTSTIVKFVIHYKIQKDRDCPGCTTLGW